MTDEIREALYPFGFIAQLAFALRFFVQWIAAEKEGRSYTPKLFWQLSLSGNIILLIHSLLQLNFPISIVQALNSILSWRNLNLLGKKEDQIRLKQVILMLIAALLATISYFFLADSLSLEVPTLFQLFGLVGISCYALRFWVQWWQAESEDCADLSSSTAESRFNESFWWISLFGAIVSSIYFFIVGDWVNFLGPAIALLPYSRNLILLKRATHG